MGEAEEAVLTERQGYWLEQIRACENTPDLSAPGEAGDV
jgi:hypothetical protein